jgi:hypothetical protein
MTMAETLMTPSTQSNEPGNVTTDTTNAPASLEANPLATQAGDWTPHIPKGSEKVFESYKGKPIGDVLKSFADAQSLIGGSIRLPKPDASPEDKAKAFNDIYNKLGRPESPDKYDLGELPALPDAVKWDDAKLSTVKSELHKIGLTNDQVKAVLGIHAKELGQFVPDNTKVAAESKEALLSHYGSEAMFSRNLNFAQKTVKEYGDADFIKWLDESGMGNNPNFIKYNAKIGRELIEHGAVDAASEMDTMTAADAQAAINKIQNDKGDLYWAKPGTPGKAERVKEVSDWYKIVAGEI